MSYKILSLDGGGTWSLIQARVLLDIYGDIRGHELLRKFDMAITNSGGSLVLACLCNDMLISDVIKVFTDDKLRKQVFSKLNFWEKLKWRNIASIITRALGPRYSTTRKVEGLAEVLKGHDHLFKEGVIATPIIETQLNNLPEIIGKKELQLLIVGYDYFKERVSFFRSNPNSLTDKFGNGKYYSLSLKHAIHSSSNAPVNYFDSPAEIDISLQNATNPSKNYSTKTWYWDGAVSGFNNPVLAGVIEAITNNYAAPQENCILSIGTGTGSAAVLTDYKNSSDAQMLAVYNLNKNNPLTLTDTSPGFIQDIRKMSTSIVGDPPDSATFIAYSILDPSLSNKAKLVRINPCVKPELQSNGWYGEPAVYNSADSKKNFNALMKLGMDAIEDAEVNLIIELCDKFITDSSVCISNQMIRGDENSVNSLGYNTYKKAKQKWVNDCM
jgi:patatin-like phospholipase/acyl hydrolase